MMWIVMAEDRDSEGVVIAVYDTEQQAQEHIDQEHAEYDLARMEYDEVGGLVEPVQPRLWIQQFDGLPPLIY